MADRPAEPREALRSAALAGVPHGFFTGIGRDGAPDPALIAPGSRLVAAKQVHSPHVLVVDAPFDSQPPEADALATSNPGLALAIVTADCVPVLLADSEAGVVGAAHAGWRGAFDGVLEATVAAMEGLGASRARIAAAIGPAIAQPSYEVDDGFVARFLAQDTANAAFFEPGKPGHSQFDLPAYVAHRLAGSGLAAIDDLAIDTYAEPARFHSYRRATHRGEPTYGRQFSMIAAPARG